MIDFVKMRIEKPCLDRIRGNCLLQKWEIKTDQQTGEITNEHVEYCGLEFDIKCNSYLYIAGSLHKFWNSVNNEGYQNYNELNFQHLVFMIKDFCTWFELNPAQCLFESIEFGVNLSSKIETSEILSSAISHKGKSFSDEYSTNKQFRVCERQDYNIKIYDKGLQYTLPNNTLRFEVKAKRMVYLKRMIVSLSDLLVIGNIERLGIILLKEFYDILFYDYTIIEADLTERNRLFLVHGQNPKYWKDMLKEKSEKGKRSSYYKKRNQFRKIVAEFGNQDIGKIVGAEISKKWNDLLKWNDLNYTPSDLFKNVHFTTSGMGVKCLPEENKYELKKKEVKGGLGESPKINSDKTQKRFCGECGKDISRLHPLLKVCKNDLCQKKLKAKYSKTHREKYPRPKTLRLPSNCRECGIDISHRSPLAKVCEECRQVIDSEYKARYKPIQDEKNKIRRFKRSLTKTVTSNGFINGLVEWHGLNGDTLKRFIPAWLHGLDCSKDYERERLRDIKEIDQQLRDDLRRWGGV
jgi:hypothetical protein